jgi:hypothetical protein
MHDHVFICYAREDQVFTLELAGNLRDRGIPVWIDQVDIPTGADWDMAIDDALYECATLLIVISPDAVSSTEVRGELRTALDEGKTILPLIHKACRIPRQLRLLQYADFTNLEPADEDGLKQVLEALGIESTRISEQRPARSGLANDNVYIRAQLKTRGRLSREIRVIFDDVPKTIRFKFLFYNINNRGPYIVFVGGKVVFEGKSKSNLIEFDILVGKEKYSAMIFVKCGGNLLMPKISKFELTISGNLVYSESGPRP